MYPPTRSHSSFQLTTIRNIRQIIVSNILPLTYICVDNSILNAVCRATAVTSTQQQVSACDLRFGRESDDSAASLTRAENEKAKRFTLPTDLPPLLHCLDKGITILEQLHHTCHVAL